LPGKSAKWDSNILAIITGIEQRSDDDVSGANSARVESARTEITSADSDSEESTSAENAHANDAPMMYPNGAFTAVHDWVFDILPHFVQPSTWVVYMQLYRQSMGHQTNTVKAAASYLSALTTMSERTIKECLKDLMSLGLIRRIGKDKDSSWIYMLMVPEFISAAIAQVKAARAKSAHAATADEDSAQGKNCTRRKAKSARAKIAHVGDVAATIADLQASAKSARAESAHSTNINKYKQETPENVKRIRALRESLGKLK
jgi:hypothetical protein